MTKDNNKNLDKEPKKTTRKKVVEEVKEEVVEISPDVIVKKEGFNLLEVILIMFITLVFGAMLGSGLTLARSNNTPNNNNVVQNQTTLPNELKEFVETYNNIKDGYYEEVDKDKLLDAGIKGMIDFLGDKYSVYMDEEETKNFEEEVEGKYVGIATEIAIKYLDEEDITKFDIIISRPFENGPAYKAGLRKDDKLLKVNDEDITNLPLTKVASKIKGIAGTKVKITVERDGEILDFNVTREEVELDSATSKMFEVGNKKIGYIKLDIFAANTANQFEKQLIKLESEKIDSLIVDVRDNSGGYLSTVTDIASMFLDKTKKIYQLDTRGKVESIYSKTATSRSYPITVLINEYSASASEILAGALLESYGADVVGVNSYGKGTVQQAYQLESGATVKYTIQKWLTPNGNWINEKGITPTVKIEQDLKYYDTLADEDDTQLQKALELLNK